MNIAVDVMGGDHAPANAIRYAIRVAKQGIEQNILNNIENTMMSARPLK